MIKELKISNYRCFEDHVILFNDLTIAVGKNNAGKSTFIEAVRLLSLITSRFQNSIYRDAPSWCDLPKRYKGISPSIESIELSLKNIFHRYSEPPARINAEFENGAKIELYIGRESKLFGVIINCENEIITNKAQARKLTLPNINILPQIGPLRDKETIRNEDYVLKNVNSSLSSIHFRNQLHYLNQYFDRFVENIGRTWQGLRILELERSGEPPEIELDLLIQDGNFVAEIGWMGHGLQMWLQTMWFLARCSNDSTIILDEPDVYMHADLQRKLIRFLKNQFKQVIIATHSIEIMSEVEPQNILIIDKSKGKSKYATNLPTVQRIVNNIGSIHNIHLARLSSAKKVLIVEGKDVQILKRLQTTCVGSEVDSFDIIPNFSIGGWGGWNYAIGSKLLLKNTGDEELITYCIFDSDYHTEEEKEQRLIQAKDYSVCLHIWGKKEIENYLLVSKAIARIINREKRKGSNTSNSEVNSKMLEIAELFKDDITDCIATEIQMKNRNHGAGKVHKEARGKVKIFWAYPLSHVSGKDVIARLSEWSQSEYNVSLSSNKIASELEKNEINIEMRQVIEKISHSKHFK